MSPLISRLDTQDGSHTLLSEKFGVSYHSKYGAIQESRHVFIEAGLHLKLPVQKHIRILEMGFGTGLNALLSAAAIADRDNSISYHTVDAYPISPEEAETLNYPDLLAPYFAEAKTFFRQMHTLPWGEEQQLGSNFSLLKLQQKLEEVDLDGPYDLIYFDAFAPSAQPELWSAEVLEKVVASMAPKAVFVTYCAKGVVKRTLRDLGLTVEGIPGPPGKREMTRAIKED